MIRASKSFYFFYVYSYYKYYSLALYLGYVLSVVLRGRARCYFHRRIRISFPLASLVLFSPCAEDFFSVFFLFFVISTTCLGVYGCIISTVWKRLWDWPVWCYFHHRIRISFLLAYLRLFSPCEDDFFCLFFFFVISTMCLRVYECIISTVWKRLWGWLVWCYFNRVRMTSLRNIISGSSLLFF